MESIIIFLNNLGIHVDESTPHVIILSGYYLVLSVMLLLNILNIVIYLASIYIVSNEKLLNKIPSKYAYVHKFLGYYKNVRVIYIIIEFIFVLILLFIMNNSFWCFIFIYIYMSISSNYLTQTCLRNEKE